jgi:hypothetical protein
MDGANLLCSGRQHVPLAEYKQNLGALVDRLQALGAQVVVITPAPVDEAARSKLNQQVGRFLILNTSVILGSTFGSWN